MKLNEQDGAEDLKKLDHKLTAEFAVSLALKKKKKNSNFNGQGLWRFFTWVSWKSLTHGLSVSSDTQRMGLSVQPCQLSCIIVPFIFHI